jgi:hypothetical protein
MSFEKASPEELALYQKLASLQLAHDQLEQRWESQRRTINDLLEERMAICQKLGNLGISLQPNGTLILKPAWLSGQTVIANPMHLATLDSDQLLEWVRGFGEAGHFISEEACQDFANQLEKFIKSDGPSAPMASLEDVRKNLIAVLELDDLMGLDDSKHASQFHNAMIAYAQERVVKADDECKLAQSIIEDFGLSQIARTPEEHAGMVECVASYYELTKKV